MTYHKFYNPCSARRPNFDYSSSAAYFVTICTKNKQPFFGSIEKEKPILSDIGKIVEEEWKRTSLLRSYISIDKYVVMPDHFHGILTFNQEDPVFRSRKENIFTSKISPQKHSLSVAIRFFKRQVTIRSKKLNPEFEWQRLFHDRIILSQKEYLDVKKYISENPANWEKKYNK